MTSKSVAFLLADLGSPHSRPHVSNDNRFSEAQFKTLKYRPAFPGRFDSIQDARLTATSSFPGTTSHIITAAWVCQPLTTCTSAWPTSAWRPRANVLTTAYSGRPQSLTEARIKASFTPTLMACPRCQTEDPLIGEVLPGTRLRWRLVVRTGIGALLRHATRRRNKRCARALTCSSS
jgi:hypothetical protein